MQKKAPSQPHSHALTSHNRATLPQQHVPSRSSFCTQFSTFRARSCILCKTIVSSFPTTLTFYPRQVCNWFSGLPSSRRAGLFYYFRFQAGFFFLLLPGHNMATVDHVMAGWFQGNWVHPRILHSVEAICLKLLNSIY